MHSIDDVNIAVAKAACIQAMHDHANRDIPIAAEVDPEMMRPIIRRAPSVLKNYLVGKRNEVRNGIAYNGALRNPQAPRRPIPIWADLSQETATHAKEIGWDVQEKGPNTEMWKVPIGR